jgi:hypothetical protein
MKFEYMFVKSIRFVWMFAVVRFWVSNYDLFWINIVIKIALIKNNICVFLLNLIFRIVTCTQDAFLILNEISSLQKKKPKKIFLLKKIQFLFKLHMIKSLKNRLYLHIFLYKKS